MAIFVEFRVPMPITMKEYEIGYRYTDAKMKLEQTGDNKGCLNIMYNEGIHCEQLGGDSDAITNVLNLSSQIPYYLNNSRYGNTEVFIHSYRIFPKNYAEYSEPEFMKQHFYIINNGIVLDDNGNSDNALNLTGEKLTNRVIEIIDIRNTALNYYDKDMSEDPATCALASRNSELLPENWMETETNIVTSYQFNDILYLHFSLQGMGEKNIQTALRRILQVFHRKMYCWMDEWKNMTLNEVKIYEKQVFEKLNIKIREPEFSGMVFR